MNPELKALVEQRLRVLRVFAGSAIVSLAVFAAVGYAVTRQAGAVVPDLPQFLPLLIAVAWLAAVAGASIVVRRILVRAQGLPPRDRLAPFQSAVIVGIAMRESAGVVGLVLTILTGSVVWVLSLAALAAVAIIVTFPGQRGADRTFSDAPPIG